MWILSLVRCFGILVGFGFLVCFETEEDMAEEGQVIGCHTLETWNEHLQKGNESKKLVSISAL